ncbi:DUF898 family protein [Flavimaricola marinus]|uniref:Inner membrane protein YjgN n=1 Tax=Flavimaricola marinus TaxID=1819565 RepID=A0A238LA42_9RHOB|nr:DUF898 family protein [Flavimaricola marinus]SMY06452.1 hypothetical protein LOM8899_00577 [Flavimaricola marinus]
MSVDEVAPVAFAGRRGSLMALALRVGLLTLATLGVYRFWGRTRLRRWYWSAVQPGGDPLEYTGDGAEKFAGFLMAVCVLALWLGVVNLLLMFVSLSWLAAPWLAYVLSVVGLIPVWAYARYRARAYMLARTRWRGIRFGMAPGAAGYAGRVCLHGMFTLATLGALWPRMTFKLEKYRTDRTYFGTLRLHQGGQWTILLPAYTPVLVCGAFALASLLLAATSTPRMVWLAVPFGIGALYGIVRYRVLSIRLMAEAKTAGGLSLIATPDPVRVARIVGFGWLAITIVLALPLIGAAFVYALAPAGRIELLLATDPTNPLALLALALFLILYFGLFVAYGVLRHGLITMPLWRHYAESLTVTGTSALAAVRQRDRQAAPEAGGLAEALDIGAAI